MNLRDIFDGKAFITEMPNFGYTNFNDREKDIKNLHWQVTSSTSGITIAAFVEESDDTESWSDDRLVGRIRALSSRNAANIMSIKIKTEWHGTGLGQMLYDRLIAQAKKDGYKYVCSDYERSAQANKAWERLAKRYPVVGIPYYAIKHEDQSVDPNAIAYYQIDLSKVNENISESPDFSYSRFVDREEDIKKLIWKIKKVGPSTRIEARPKENKEYAADGVIEAFEELGSLHIRYVGVKWDWRGTGLGQMLYDRLIAYAKKRKMTYIYADERSVSPEAHKAWQRLSKRYHVEKLEGSSPYRIDLKKNNTTISESTNVTDSPAFKKWFAGSKIVDEHGKPLRCYHGAHVGNITKFLPRDMHTDDTSEGPKLLAMFLRAQKENSQFGYMNFRGGSFFSPDPDYAGHYAEDGKGGTVYPVYIRAENPLYFSQKKGEDVIPPYPTRTPDALIMILDGKINEIAVIDPNQVKSAIGNNGNFSLDSHHISEAKEDRPKKIPKDWVEFKNIKEGVKPGKAHDCQLNSARTNKTLGLKTCVGVIWEKNPSGTFVDNNTFHAWNIDDQGNVVDSTLGSDEAKDYRYFGEVVPNSIGRNGTAIDRYGWDKWHKASKKKLSESVELPAINWKKSNNNWNEDHIILDQVPLNKIVASQKFRSRKTVNEYVEKMKNGDPIDIIWVTPDYKPNSYYIAPQTFGGHHRMWALRKLGYTDQTIPVYLVDYKKRDSWKDWITESKTDLPVVNKSLNPKLWKDGHLRKKVESHLEAIAESFIMSLELKHLDIVDIIISGSNAAYTYTETSDIDLHIVIKIAKEKQELYRNFFTAKKNVYNSEHDLTIYGFPVELYVQFEDEPHIASGLYSLLNSEWIKKPIKPEIEVNDKAISIKIAQITKLINEVMKANNYQEANVLWDKIKNYRKVGLKKDGEFGLANIVFKKLRSSGLLDKFDEFRTNYLDSKLSLE